MTELQIKTPLQFNAGTLKRGTTQTLLRKK